MRPLEVEVDVPVRHCIISEYEVTKSLVGKVREDSSNALEGTSMVLDWFLWFLES